MYKMRHGFGEIISFVQKYLIKYCVKYGITPT